MSDRKKILILTPGELPVPAAKGGAVETLITSLLQENERAGVFQMDVFSIADPRNRKLEGRYYKILPVNMPGRLKILDRLSCRIRGLFIPAWKLPFYRNFHKKKYYAAEILRHLKRCSYDWIVVENNMSLLPAVYRALGEETFRSICVYHMHSVLIDNPAALPYLSRCRRILSVSHFEADTVRKEYKELAKTEFRVVKNGVSRSCFGMVQAPADREKLKETLRKNRKKELGIAKGEYVFLYSGRLSIEKGVRELLEAFGRLQGKVCLVLAGGSYSGSLERSGYEKGLRKFAREKKLRVIFAGFVPNKEMASYYGMADVLVIPSVVGEAGPLTALEALTAGIPVLSARIGALPEYLGEYAAYAEPGEHFVEELARKMQEFYDRRLSAGRASAGQEARQEKAQEDQEIDENSFYRRFVKALR